MRIPHNYSLGEMNWAGQLATALQTGTAVLATVTAVQGSVPREVGAKLVLDAQGNVFGTIGGGAGEAKVIQLAQQLLQTGDKQFVEIDLSGAPQREVQGVCGGWMQVWVERWQGEAAIALMTHVCTLLKLGQSVQLITPISDNRSPYLLPLTVTPPADELVEILQPPPTLLIVGAGHVGMQLATVADLIGFQVVVQDDRPEWANPTRYPQASQIFSTPIASALAHLADCTPLYAALVTRGYQYDLEALDLLLQRAIACTYIGMIGSHKRVRQVYRAIAQRGIATDKLHSIHAPIGLDIGALTPAEIAISISAELILVRRGGTGRSLSQMEWRDGSS